MSESIVAIQQRMAENAYIEGVEFFDEVCGELCNREMKAECKGCRMFLMASNYAFHYSMNWFSLMQTELETWRKTRKILVSTVKNEREIPGTCHKNKIGRG